MSRALLALDVTREAFEMLSLILDCASSSIFVSRFTFRGRAVLIETPIENRPVARDPGGAVPEAVS